MDAGSGARDFADPARTADDLALLRAMREAQRAQGRAAAPAERFGDDAGGAHWLVVPDWASLAGTRPAVAVGFFGQARDDVDHAPLVALEHELVADARSRPGLLAYHNVRLAGGQWGNLVVLASRAAAERQRDDARHHEAIRRSAAHYRSLRLHRLRLPDGALGRAGLVLDETLLIDLAGEQPWRAVRPAPQAS